MPHGLLTPHLVGPEGSMCAACVVVEHLYFREACAVWKVPDDAPLTSLARDSVFITKSFLVPPRSFNRCSIGPSPPCFETIVRSQLSGHTLRPFSVSAMWSFHPSAPRCFCGDARPELWQAAPYGPRSWLVVRHTYLCFSIHPAAVFNHNYPRTVPL